MNFPQNSSDSEYKIKKKKINPSKNSITKDISKIIPSNQMTITSSKNSNSVIHHTHISTFEDEEIEKAEEEEEINSDEYVSSTNLDVDTNTYINTETNDGKNENDKNINIINQKGRIRPKYDDNKNRANNIFLNNIYNTNKTINIDKNDINKSNKIINNNDIIKKGHQYFRTDLINDINNRQCSTTKGEKVVVLSNSIEKNNVFTPNNKDKKALKLLKGIILKQMKQGNNKNIKYRINKLNTIIPIENNLKQIDNKIRNNNVIYSSHNNNNINLLSKNNNTSDKNIQIKNIQQRNIQNNNININIYNKNIIKDVGGINIDGQKYHLIPQTNKKLKTQGRVGNIIYDNQNKKNNFLYIINTMNNNSTINNNKIPTSPIIKKNNITINNNRINSPEIINNNKKEDSRMNIHNIKNLKADNIQKTIQKYFLDNKYMTILPSSPNERKNTREIKNIKYVKKENTTMNSINNNKIFPANNNNNIDGKRKLRNVNSYYSKKINKNIFNSFRVESILNTISNNHNQRNKLNNNSSQDNNTLNDALSLKKKRFNKNKFVLQSCIFNLDNPIKENISLNNNKSSFRKKVKPLNQKTKLDLTNEDNIIEKKKYNSRIKNNVTINNNNNKLKNNPSIKRVIYITNNNQSLKNINNTKTLIMNSLSPNSLHMKQIIKKNNNSKNSNNSNNQRKSIYYIYTSNRLNNNNYMNNSGNKILYRKVQKDKTLIKNRINNSNTINYNIDNNDFSNNKKYGLHNNNVNKNALNSLKNLDEDKMNKSHIYKKIEIINSFPSINNNLSHKKFNISNNINYINNNIKNNNKIRHNHTHTLTNINSNNIIYELSNNNLVSNFGRFNNNKINNFNGNNFLYFSNDKERATLNNKSYGNLSLNNNKRIHTENNRVSYDIFKMKKSMSPIDEIKNKFN